MPRNKKEEIKPEPENKFTAAMRIYISITGPDGNHLTTDEFLDCIEHDSISDFCKWLIDTGIVNVYHVEFNKMEKII